MEDGALNCRTFIPFPFLVLGLARANQVLERRAPAIIMWFAV